MREFKFWHRKRAFKGFTLISKACKGSAFISLLSLRKRSCKGFTLIEMMVVISIIAILVVVGVPTYNQYSNGQKLIEATNQLQTVLRQAQNNAQTGTQCKIAGGATSKANYWYVALSEDTTGNSNTSYSLSASCETGTQTPQQTTLPSGISITNIVFRNDPLDATGCSPLNAEIRFINVSSELKLDASCLDSVNKFVEITLSLQNSTNTRTVVVEKGGGIYVQK